jgi:ABC-type glycerol-3-phosphate transport system permease component
MTTLRATAVVAARTALLAALLFPVYWMAVASLTPESQLFTAAALGPARPSLDD